MQSISRDTEAKALNGRRSKGSGIARLARMIPPEGKRNAAPQTPRQSHIQSNMVHMELTL
jgi:hypothetical protein